jgi:acetylornithine deacetylase/succinyl-diaminopimelate desuccinylase-like protein
MTAIDRIIQERLQEWMQIWKDTVRIPSVATNKAALDSMRALLSQLLVRQGLAVELLETPGQPVILATSPPIAHAPTVLIYGHYDVQPAALEDGWATQPFDPVERDGRLFGRGTADNKGQHLAQIFGMAALLEASGSLPVNVKMIIEGEEESGSPHLAAVAERWRERLAADLAITSDGPMALGDQPLVILGVRGVLSFELSVRGAAWDNHSGHRGNVVPNPAWRLVEVLSTLRSPDGRVLIPGFYDAVAPWDQEVDVLLNTLPFDAEALATASGLAPQALSHWTAKDYYTSLMTPVFSINGLLSGYTAPGHKTIIPASATARCDMRLVPNQEPDAIIAALACHLDHVAPDVTLRVQGDAMSPSYTNPRHPAIARVVNALGQAFGRQALIQPIMGGSLPDAVFTRTLGIPSIIVPYANYDEANHGPNENMRIDLFQNAIKATALILLALASVDNA